MSIVMAPRHLSTPTYRCWKLANCSWCSLGAQYPRCWLTLLCASMISFLFSFSFFHIHIYKRTNRGLHLSIHFCHHTRHPLSINYDILNFKLTFFFLFRSISCFFCSKIILECSWSIRKRGISLISFILITIRILSNFNLINYSSCLSINIQWWWWWW